MLTQIIADEIIKSVSNSLSNFSGQNIKGYGIGTQQIDGRVVTIDENSGERDYIGLSDKEGNFFYLRYSAKVDLRPFSASNQRGACVADVQVSAPIRAVLVYDCENPLNLAKIFNNSFYGVDLPRHLFYGHAIERARINPKAYNWDAYQNFKEESKTDDDSFSTSLQIITFDFSIEYVTSFANCAQIKKC